MTTATATPKPASLGDALPFWASAALLPVLALSATLGGLAIFLVPMTTWGFFTILDLLTGEDRSNIDPDTPEARLAWYLRITRLWPWLQLAALLALLAYVPAAPHLSMIEKFGVFFGMGILAGTIGIVYAHELMHKPGRADRWRADILLASVLYGHFRTEHMLVHHRHVGTPRDPVTAPYGEGFHAFFARVLPGCFRSALRAERERLARKGLPATHISNPFWRYAALAVAMIALAIILGGWLGLALFLFQALVAIWQLELVNYVEHYGLTRQTLPDGRYEPVAPRHSWNATHRGSNWLLINLQRHADHHAKPARPFPLLQAGSPEEGPELPYGYPVMTTAALVPPLWRRIMHPRVKRWRKRFYPDITDWPARA
ncbi:alkane 1-monooxygenase [Ovoidimarina sediminis]|uniref:alkane 1-monooxygenase n=1 Tax=Ovoidimarina sediminis TaxID=3079856 RepID=UPI002912D4FE|nr:alkane 1-monooxygenase [Rhodophyticola sp. MJ-SS7]MDU8942447.1 alkane 1-monooxygenase [Rhodophyticola sp. MJ-SS7]